MSLTIQPNPSLARLQQVQDASPSAAGRLHGTASTTSVEQVQAATRLADIKDVMKEVFDSHRQEPTPHGPPGSPATPAEFDRITEHNKGVETHNAQIDSLIDSRAAKLQEIGETPADIRATLGKAPMLDRISTNASSALRSTPFAAASVLLYMKPLISEGKWLPTDLQSLKPFIPGAVFGVMDTVGNGIMNQVTGNAHYLKASPDQLHDAMTHSLKNNDPGKKQKVLDHGIGIQGYSVRNAVRTGVGTLMEYAAPLAKGAMDINLVVALGAAANAAYGNRIHTTEQRDSLRGAAFLFGRKDAQPKKDMADETEWLDTYKALKDASVSSVAFNAAKRLAGLPIDALTDGASAFRGLATATTLAQNGIGLSAGFAAVGMAQGALAGLVKHPVAKEAVSQLTNTVLSAGVFAGWTALGVVTDPVADKAEKFLKNDVKGAPAAAAKMGIQMGNAGIDAGKKVGQAGIEKSIKVGQAGIKAGKAGIEEGVRLGAQGADYARVTGANLNRRYNELTRRTRQPDVEAAGEGLGVASTGNTGDIPLGVVE
ncbi:type III effector [Pseudomonas sp. RTC3]|uniref:type III effector n=1 Tax=Pseudomonas sp. 5C2 TaxID=3048588 RepID=UPI002AB4065B|nr:type III effector [Pseudomonas sp. 5C2]MDY7564700.1 type III effector [Pseudomonas sp. 5C2]MEB0060653.1 type III effector [Pseudomonas sp. RTC3]MEB0240888.1 type III effector [Pseudomonas sp. 5C2]